MTGTVLLVEDEQSIGGLVRGYLEREGNEVVWTRSGEEAVVELTRHPVRLVLLDIGLPGMDGFDLCYHLRSSTRIPVIMLTARDEEADRVAGLELGADDYVTKPFSPRELAARVKAVLRRTEPAEPEDTIALGDVVIDRRGREVSVGGEPVELRAREF